MKPHPIKKVERKRKSLTSQSTTVTISLPRVAMDYDPVQNTHRWVFSWGDAEKEMQWTNDYMRYNPEKIAEAVNKTLAELCAMSKPYSVSHLSKH